MLFFLKKKKSKRYTTSIRFLFSEDFLHVSIFIVTFISVKLKLNIFIIQWSPIYIDIFLSYCYS